MGFERLQQLISNIEKVIVGKTEVIKLLLVGLLNNGHILIEDAPGVGKTMLSLALAKSINADFKRIQFTPDLLPSDVTGGFIYNPKSGEFEVRKGPVFANIVLADEINRTTPRTQSALLECMQEYKVTLDGKVFPLPTPFMVIATENPIEFQGTYPLPEAQIDRFLLKIKMGYLSIEDELKVIVNQKITHPIDSLSGVMTLQELEAAQNEVKQVEVSQHILRYIVELVATTRKSENIKLGASPRGSIALMKAACAWAFLEGRDYVIPDDVAMMLPHVLRHRLILEPRALVSGKDVEVVINDLIAKTAVP